MQLLTKQLHLSSVEWEQEQQLPFLQTGRREYQAAYQHSGPDNRAFLLETSAFAAFKDLPLPSGTGSIKGIVSKTYNGRNLVLALNDGHDAWLAGGDCVD